MKIAAIETLPVVQQAAQVLGQLEKCGLVEPAIASGWIRGYLTRTTPSDIDIAYVGPVAPEDAQQYLRDTLTNLGIDPSPWDIAGIWNAELAYGVKHTAENYLLYYINSIDTVYLAADGKLHDPTGHGFADAEHKILRLNTHNTTAGRMPTAKEETYVCLEGCRRIAKFGWAPTPYSADRIRQGVGQWQELSPTEQHYFIHKKITGKYNPNERLAVRPTYDSYGWGFVFDLADLSGG